MWIYTDKGFISVVAHRTDPTLFLVRGRSKAHLETMFPTHKVESTPNADYGFRIYMEKVSFQQWMKREVTKLTYPNFKNSIREESYHQAASDVWAIMLDYQRGFYRQAKMPLPDRDWSVDWND